MYAGKTKANGTERNIGSRIKSLKISNCREPATYDGIIDKDFQKSFIPSKVNLDKGAKNICISAKTFT